MSKANENKGRQLLIMRHGKANWEIIAELGKALVELQAKVKEIAPDNSVPDDLDGLGDDLDDLDDLEDDSEDDDE